MAKLFLNPNQIELILYSAEKNPRDYALLMTAFETGLRASDMSRLRVDRVVASDGTVMPTVIIKMLKTGKRIERPITERCRSAITRYLDYRASRRWPDVSPYLFRPEGYGSRRSALPLRRSSIHRLYKKYLMLLFTAVALKGNACHVTRRSTAKMIANTSKGGIEAAAAFLGHDDLVSTIHYLDMEEAIQHANDAVFKIYGNPIEPAAEPISPWKKAKNHREKVAEEIDIDETVDIALEAVRREREVAS